MTELEFGLMAGFAVGFCTAGAMAGVLDWWGCRSRVVTIRTGYQPSAPVVQDDAFGVNDVVVKKGPVGKVECCVCDGTGVRPYFPGNGYIGPNLIPCGRCRGTGWMTLPPKKP